MHARSQEGRKRGTEEVKEEDNGDGDGGRGGREGRTETESTSPRDIDFPSRERERDRERERERERERGIYRRRRKKIKKGSKEGNENFLLPLTGKHACVKGREEERGRNPRQGKKQEGKEGIEGRDIVRLSLSGSFFHCVRYIRKGEEGERERERERVSLFSFSLLFI